MNAFFTWLESLGWAQVAFWYFIACIALCIFTLWLDQHLATSEQRAIKRRDRNAAKRSDTLLQFPIERARIKDGRLYRAGRIERKDIDPAYRTGSFHVPYSMADKKGLTK